MKQNKDPSGRLLTRAEVAEIFQVSPSTITRWAEAGKLPAVKTLGGHRRYEAEAVFELAEHLTSTLFDEIDTSIEKETSMEKVSITVPAMYGDHHVLEVRRLLLEMPGVADVNASSCFQTAEISYDPAKTSPDELTNKLNQAGYLEALPVPVETGIPVTQEAKRNGKGYFRHTTSYEQTKRVVSFAQTISSSGRPLWPCPGVGVITSEDLEKEISHG